MSTSNRTVKEIVQHKGWLYKRGEGYEEEDMVAFPFLQITTPNGTAPPTPANGKAKPSFATTTNSAAPQEPDAMLSSLLSGFRLGKSEKKRYFKLVTIEERPIVAESSTSLLASESTPRQTKRSSLHASLYGDNEVRVELRYYLDEKAEGTLKGVIVLTADCTLETSSEDASLVLQTPGRKYYLRPCDGPVTSVTARTTSHQWADAIKRELRVLFQAKQLKRQIMRRSQTSGMFATNSGAVMPSPLLNNVGSPPAMGGGGGRNVRGESTFLVEPEQLPQNLSEILANQQSRIEFRAFLDSALAVENLDFYEAVEQCSTQQDMERIMQRFVKPGSAQEVNLAGHQRTYLLKLTPPYERSQFQDAQVEIFKLMETNFFKRFHREAVEKTGAFAALYTTLGVDGFNIVLQHFGPIKTDLERLLSAMRAKLECAQQVLAKINRELASSSREVAVREQSTSRRALMRIYHATLVRMDALQDYCECMSTEVVLALTKLMEKIDQDLKTIYTSVERELADLETCKRMLAAFVEPNIELENALEHLESTYTKPMESAMAKLESLELYRIETCREVMLYAVMAEKNLASDTAKATEMLANATNTVDVSKDIYEFCQITGRELMAAIALH